MSDGYYKYLCQVENCSSYIDQAKLRTLGAYDLRKTDHHPGYIIIALFLRASAGDGVISSKRPQRKIATFA